MANANQRGRHRSAAKPSTPFDSLKSIDTRKGFVAAATTGLALGTVWAGSALAAPEGAQNTVAQATPVAAQVGDAVAKAHLAVAANPEITAPENVNWTEGQVVLPGQQEAQQEAAQNAATTAQHVSYNAAPVSIPANIAGGSIADIALRYQGVPYVYGGTTPGGFDCSGFVGYVYRQAGIGLPRTSWGQGSAGTQVSAAEAQAGDIVYYGGHVGIYLGGGKMIHAPQPGQSVSVVNVFGSPSYVRVANAETAPAVAAAATQAAPAQQSTTAAE